MLPRNSPDRRLGEPSSGRARRSRPRPDPYGPPSSLYRAFYFHHSDPEFKRMYPHDWCSQLGLNEEEIQGGPEGVKSGPPNSSTSVLSASSQVRISQTPNRDEYNEKCKTESGQRLKETNAGQVMKRPKKHNLSMVPDFAQNINIDIARSGRSQTSVPINTITRPGSR